MGVGAPATATIDAYHGYPSKSVGGGMGRSERANASAAIDAGRARIMGAKSSRSVGRFSVALYISNHIPYLGKINAKTNQNSPFWIETALAEGAVLKGFRVFESGGGEE